MRVLVIEDDPTVGKYVASGLTEHGMQVDLVVDGETGLEQASASFYEVIVLDLRLPGMPGVEVLRTLRDREVATPVLVLTANDVVESKVQTLRTGADDYVTKPFAFEELLARVEALGRRPREISNPQIEAGEITIDTGAREITVRGETVDLTPKEYSVLEYLARNQNRVMSRTLITEYVWGYHFDPGTNIVDVVINRLRKKIEGGDNRMIHTIRGVGYVLKP